MNYKAGDKVRIKSFDWYYKNRDRKNEVKCGRTPFIPEMVPFCEKIATISSVQSLLEVYRIKEDGGTFNWTDEMFEGNLEEETYDFLKTDKSNLPEIKLPDGYIFKDENGNIINATKIVMEKKEKKYPKTYVECCEILGVDSDNFFTITNYYEGEVETTDYERGLLSKFDSLWGLRICRDAYWKIAGEEMGLGKPWKPDWEDSEERRYSIVNIEGDINLPDTTLTKWILKVTNKILVFPTEEMRDAFYENFKELIERCKELL